MLVVAVVEVVLLGSVVVLLVYVLLVVLLVNVVVVVLVANAMVVLPRYVRSMRAALPRHAPVLCVRGPHARMQCGWPPPRDPFCGAPGAPAGDLRWRTRARARTACHRTVKLMLGHS